MPVSTKLSLNLPEGTDINDAPVKTSISDQMAIIDECMDGKLTTDPTALALQFDGRVAYHYTIDFMRIRKTAGGNNWTWIGSPNRPRGRKAYVSNSSVGPTVVAGQEAGPYISATVALSPGRKYNIHWFWNIDRVAGSAPVPLTRTNIRVAQGGVVASNSQNISAVWTDLNDRGSGNSIHHQGFTTFDSGSIPENTNFTFGMFLERIASGDGKSVRVASWYNVMCIEDVGTFA